MKNNPTTLRARELRQTANSAEMALWSAIKGQQLGGYKFTRQFPLGPYFIDFACRKHFFLIELDGAQHTDNPYDNARYNWLLNEGYTILRLPCSTVLIDRDAVCETILAALEDRMEDHVEAPDLRFHRSNATPRRFKRHRPWNPHPPLTPH